MKRIILLLLLCPSLFFSQSYEIIYEEFFVSANGGSIDSLQERLKNNDDSTKTNLTSYKKLFRYTDGISSYNIIDKSEEIIDQEKSNSTEIYSYKIQMATYYKNQKENLFLNKYPNYSSMLYGEDILITDTLLKHDWELTNIEENVSGYTCKLAKTVDYKGNSILIWYTDEIPINDGPREFWGLPGLVIQLQINEAVLVVAKSIKKLDKKIDIKKIEGGNVMTIKEFLVLKKELEKPGVRTLPDGTMIKVH
ncbi:GLPGLI family protein [Aquimarina sp. M1]